jgi:hypothetical protein
LVIGMMPRHDRQIEPCAPARLDKVAVGIDVVEVLGDRSVGTGRHLVGEMVQLTGITGRLGVHLGIGGHLDGEVVATVAADEFHQFAGIGKPPAAQPRRQVATQGDDAADACLPVTVEQFTDLLAAVATE